MIGLILHQKITSCIKKGGYLISFFVPFFIMMLIYWKMGMAPFGEKSILIYDMSDQYVCFFSELRNIIQGNSSLFFSWSKSYGSSFIGVFAYYVSSPFSLFTLLFKPENLPIALMYLTAIKIGCAGLSIYIYFNCAFKKCGIMTVLLSICYALMSYSCVYALSIMWLDGLIWLPMILLGIEKLLCGKFPWLLTVSFWAMFISNYYISYMVGIFSVLYLLFRCFGEKREWKKILRYFLHFAFSVLIAVGLSAWMLLPVGFDLFSGKLAEGGGTAAGGMYFGILDFLHKLLPRKYDNITGEGAFPSIYCGTIPLILSVTYFFLPKIKLREKILSIGILILFAISFCSKRMDFIWHCFQYPNCFPYRYAFLFSFFIIFLAFNAICHLPDADSIANLIKSKTAVNRLHLVGILLFLAIFSFQALELARNGKYMLERLDMDFHYKSLASYQEFYQELLPFKERGQTQNEFFRMEKDFERSKNDSMTFGYKGITHYSSLYNERVNRFTKQIGLGQGWFWNSYYGNTPVTDMLFNVKYIMSQTDMPSLYHNTEESENVTLYESPYTLPVAYMARNASETELRAFEAQNHMLNEVSGLNYQYFKESESTNLKENQFVFTALQEAPYYLYIPVEENISGSIYVNDVFCTYYSNGETKRIHYIGEFQKGETVTISVENDEQINQLIICCLDTKLLEEAFHKLKEGGLDVTEYGADYIKGRIHALEPGMMFTSIPYDVGFQVTLNGKKADTGKAFDTFLSFDVPAGVNEIEIRYVARGQRMGMLLSIFSAVLGLVLILKYKLMNKNG